MKVMKRTFRAIGLLLVAIVSIAAIGYLSNLLEARRLEIRIRKDINDGYSHYKQYWLRSKATSSDAYRRPHRLPEHLRWLESEELAVLNHTPSRIEIPFNNEIGHFSVPNPARILGDREYVPKQTIPCPWAFTKKRIWHCPFFVTVEHASLLGPLSGYGGAKGYWSFFGMNGNEKQMTRWVS